jgi:hypothetical protein
VVEQRRKVGAGQSGVPRNQRRERRPAASRASANPTTSTGPIVCRIGRGYRPAWGYSGATSAIGSAEKERGTTDPRNTLGA